MATRILFVDDEPGIRLTLAPILQEHGFSVSTAGSVPDALELINHQAFDVLLSDLNIGQPGDGFTVVSAMRRVQPEACTFILTGYPDFETALQAIRGQVDDYLLKPTDVPTLLQAIQTKLDRRRPPGARSADEASLRAVAGECGRNLQNVASRGELPCRVQVVPFERGRTRATHPRSFRDAGAPGGRRHSTAGGIEKPGYGV